eukprot:3276756-Rhodomonas_salina.1
MPVRGDEASDVLLGSWNQIAATWDRLRWALGKGESASHTCFELQSAGRTISVKVSTVTCTQTKPVVSEPVLRAADFFKNRMECEDEDTPLTRAPTA